MQVRDLPIGGHPVVLCWRNRKIKRGVVQRELAEHPRSRRCGHADAAERNVHGFEVLTMALIDVAVVALLVAEPLP